MVLTVPEVYTSQRCSCCGRIDAGNRPTRAHLICLACGPADNAGFNTVHNIMAAGRVVCATGCCLWSGGQPRKPATARCAAATKLGTYRGVPGCLSRGALGISVPSALGRQHKAVINAAERGALGRSSASPARYRIVVCAIVGAELGFQPYRREGSSRAKTSLDAQFHRQACEAKTGQGKERFDNARKTWALSAARSIRTPNENAKLLIYKVVIV
jgi:hypothetical protein